MPYPLNNNYKYKVGYLVFESPNYWEVQIIRVPLYTCIFVYSGWTNLKCDHVTALYYK